MDRLISTIPVLITVTAVIIGATWRLLASINTVDKRVGALEKAMLSAQIKEREYHSRLIDNRITSHREACRAAQDYVTGVHRAVDPRDL